MATRPVFMPSSKPPYLTAWDAEFVYNGGFAVSQKQKNITAIHNAFHARFPDSLLMNSECKFCTFRSISDCLKSAISMYLLS